MLSKLDPVANRSDRSLNVSLLDIADVRFTEQKNTGRQKRLPVLATLPVDRGHVVSRMCSLSRIVHQTRLHVHRRERNRSKRRRYPPSRPRCRRGIARVLRPAWPTIPTQYPQACSGARCCLACGSMPRPDTTFAFASSCNPSPPRTLITVCSVGLPFPLS